MNMNENLSNETGTSINSITESIEAKVSTETNYFKITDSDKVVKPFADYLLVKVISDPYKSIGIIGSKMAPLEMSTYVLISKGDAVKQDVNEGDVLIVKSDIKFTEFIVPSKYAPLAFSAWVNDFLKMKRDEQNVFIKNNPTIILVEYILIPSYLVIAKV